MSSENEKMVNHPKHYNLSGRKECIWEMVDLFGMQITIIWAILTIYKYRYRLGNKDDPTQELGKINWYENWVEDHIRWYHVVPHIIYAIYRRKHGKSN